MKTITEERRVVTFDEAASILGYTPRSIRVLFYKMKKQNGSAPKIVKKDGRTAYYEPRRASSAPAPGRCRNVWSTPARRRKS